MCQQYENEQRGLFASERLERLRKLEDHETGKKVLTKEELKRLMIDEVMARDAGF